MRRWIRSLLLGCLVLGTTAGSVGCAEERDPINRVQANALAKSFFVGNDLKSIADDPEFYMRGTVIDVGYGAAQDGLFTSTYAQPVSRIKWEITEGYLNARLAFERIEGTDGKGEPISGIKEKAENDGQIIASFRIESHFDIRRAYNSQTGEESNVVEENTSDRPWYEREYMRIDWSQNLIATSYDFDTLAQVGLYGGVSYENLAYYVSEAGHPDAPVFDAESGYFDITNKAFATPQLLDLSSLGWGIDSYPACFLDGDFAGGTAPYGNCNPVELKIRLSFKKVVDNDYEPLDFDGYRFQAFGIFNYSSQRYGYERNYGLIDSKWYRFAARYNMWERSHYYSNPKKMTGEIACATEATTITPTGNALSDPNRDDNGDGTADECAAAGAGSRCDVFNQKCTLPYRERKQVTIPWFLSGKTDDSTFESVNWAVLEWDLAMKTSVQVARLVECRKTGGANCDADFPMWTGQQDDIDEAIVIANELDKCHRERGYDDESCTNDAKAAAQKVSDERGDGSGAAIGEVVTKQPAIVLCHNPAIASDHEACKAVPGEARLGDLRRNLVTVVDTPQTPSPWGIMVDGDDPLTGEKVAASINIWDHVTDLASQGLVDLVRYINGELPTSEITNGEYIREWGRASDLSGGGTGTTMSKEQVSERLAATSRTDNKTFREVEKVGMPEELRAAVRATEKEVADAAVSATVTSTNAIEARARMQLARGTHVETELMNQAMLDLAGVHGAVPSQGTVADQVSPLALNNPKVRSDLRKMQENALAARGACILHEAPEASALTGIAEGLTRKFPIDPNETEAAKLDRYERMRGYLKRKYTYAVIAHEMGHSIGLRHNFVSTYASLFFRPQYWQLRTKNGSVTKECTDAVSDGSTCVGPRYFDPMTTEEQSQLIWMFMHSTVMDYPGDVSQDLVGLGVYDFAAARFFYGDSVSVYADAGRLGAGTPLGAGLLTATDTFGGLFGITYGKGTGSGNNAFVDNFHYSQLQNELNVIHGCYNVTPTPPASWRADVDGNWDAVLDGKIVTVTDKDGNTLVQKCRQETVDYAGFTDLRSPTDEELYGSYYRGSHSVDPKTNRIRVPYSFATDGWADTGNVSVFRHDNGADPYEQVMFLITTQENRHIFDNYRRGRSTFTVNGAAGRSFSRYNEKLLGIAGGLGFYANIYQNFGTSQGYTFDTVWPFIVNEFVKDNMIAATVAFDHFTRELTRPQSGPHYKLGTQWNDTTLRSSDDPEGNAGSTTVIIPNGPTGYLKDVGLGGRPLNNGYADDKGEYDTYYTTFAGGYYDKIHSAILLSESEDRFVSSSRQDFYDARFRASGMADVVPDGWRRVLANALTNDRSLLGPRLEATATGKPVTDTGADTTVDPDAKLYPKTPMGWVSFWPASGPQVCFPSDGRNICYSYGSDDFEPVSMPNTIPVDPQIGWEVQKFLIAWTAAYIPANQHAEIIDSMRIYRLGADANPAFEQRIEWQDPESGQTYYAKTYGKECLFGTGASCTGGKMVEKGIAARVLEYANELTSKGYQLDVVTYPGDATHAPGFNAYGRAVVLYHPNGMPVVAADPALAVVNPDGTVSAGKPDCDQNIDPTCVALTKWDNHFAVQLANYKSVPDYLWEVVVTYGLGTPDQLGVYPN